MRLKDLCDVGTNMSDADFWLTRKGDKKSVGKPTKEFNSENIGIKVTSTEIINADYLFYMMMYMHNLGVWQEKSNGSLNLVNIRVEDVKSIQVKSI
jgi:choline kinase